VPRVGEFVRHGYPECPGKATFSKTPCVAIICAP
jgi:hypothetical protein